MPIVQLPDGTLVQLPDEPEQGPLAKMGSTLKKGAMDLVSGFGQSAGSLFQGLPKAMENMSPVTKMGSLLAKTQGIDPVGEAKKLGQGASEYWTKQGEEAGLPPGYAKSGIQSMGKSLTTPVGGPLLTLGTGLGSGLGGEAGYKLSGDQGYGRSLGEIAGGVGTGFALGPRQNVAQADIRRALDGTSDDTYRGAETLLDDFSKSGVKTHTLAEAFPENSTIQSLFTKARNSDTGGANAAKLRTQDRDADLLALTERTVDKFGKRVEPSEVANKAAAAADNYIGKLFKARTDDYGNTIAAGKPIPPQTTKMLIDDFTKAAAQETIRERKQVYLAFAASLRKASDKTPLTNLRDIVDTLKLAKDAPVGRNAATASKSEAALYDQVYGQATDFLKAVSPEFKNARSKVPLPGFERAERQFREGSEAIVDPAMAGPAGKISGRAFKDNAPIPEVRLKTIDNLQDPTNVRDTMALLQQNAPLDPDLPRQIAAALAQQKTAKGSTNVAKTLRGEVGSAQEGNLMAQLGSAGISPEPIQRNFRAAEALQGNRGPAGDSGLPRPGFGQLIRPFRTIDMAMTGRSERAVQREIAEILSNPGGLEEIKKMAQFNPNIRRLLVGLAGAKPAIELSQQER